MSGDRLALEPEVVARVRCVLAEGADELGLRRPTDPKALRADLVTERLAHHTALARQHLTDRIAVAERGLRRWHHGLAGFEAGVRAADDDLARRLT